MFKKKPLVSAISTATLLATAVSMPIHAQQSDQVLEEVIG